MTVSISGEITSNLKFSGRVRLVPLPDPVQEAVAEELHDFLLVSGDDIRSIDIRSIWTQLSSCDMSDIIGSAEKARIILRTACEEVESIEIKLRMLNRARELKHEEKDRIIRGT